MQRARPSAADYAAMKDELREKEGKGVSTSVGAKRLADEASLEDGTKRFLFPHLFCHFCFSVRLQFAISASTL